jgi:hypothetical protein
VEQERPTGGLADAPSSEAVKEAGHFGEILLLEKTVGKRGLLSAIPSAARDPVATLIFTRHKNTVIFRPAKVI